MNFKKLKRYTERKKSKVENKLYNLKEKLNYSNLDN